MIFPCWAWQSKIKRWLRPAHAPQRCTGAGRRKTHADRSRILTPYPECRLFSCFRRRFAWQVFYTSYAGVYCEKIRVGPWPPSEISPWLISTMTSSQGAYPMPHPTPWSKPSISLLLLANFFSLSLFNFQKVTDKKFVLDIFSLLTGLHCRTVQQRFDIIDAVASNSVDRFRNVIFS